MALALQQSAVLFVLSISLISGVRLDEESAPLSGPKGYKNHQSLSQEQQQEGLLLALEASQEVDAEVAEALKNDKAKKHKVTQDEAEEAAAGPNMYQYPSAESQAKSLYEKVKKDRLMADHEVTATSIRKRVMEQKQLHAMDDASKTAAAKAAAMKLSEELNVALKEAKAELKSISAPCPQLTKESAEAELAAAKKTSLGRVIIGQHAVTLNELDSAQLHAKHAVDQDKAIKNKTEKAEGEFEVAKKEFKTASEKVEHELSKVTTAEMQAKRLAAEAVVASSKAEDLGKERDSAYQLVQKTEATAKKAVTDQESAEYRATATQAAAAKEVQESHRATQKAFKAQMDAERAKDAKALKDQTA